MKRNESLRRNESKDFLLLKVLFFNLISSKLPFFPFHHRASQFNVIIEEMRSKLHGYMDRNWAIFSEIMTQNIRRRRQWWQRREREIISIIYTFGPSPRLESSLLVNVLLVSMPESFVVES